MRKLFLTAIGVVLASTATLDAAEDRVLIDGVAAQVNDHVITVGEVMNQAAPMQKRLMSLYSGKELRQKLSEAYTNTLNSVIERRLILDSVDVTKMQIPKWYVDRRAEEIIRNTFGGDREELAKVLASDRTTFAEWREEIKEHILAYSIRNANVEQAVKVAPSEVKKYYEQNRGEFLKPPMVRLRMITLPASDTSAEENIIKIREEALKNDNFAELAKKHSKGLHASEGGDWGMISPSILRTELAEIALTMKPGEVSQPIVTADEIYLLKVDDLSEQTFLPFEEAQAMIEHKFQKRQADDLYVQWIERLKQNAFVKITDVDLYR